MYWLGRYLDPVTLTYILCSSAFYTFYVDVQYLLNYKAYNHQTSHSASLQCTDSTGTLTGWPWPIFRAPLTFTPLTSPFHMSSTVRPSTTKSYIVLLLDVLTRQVPWPGGLDLYFALQWLTHFMLMFGISSNRRPTTTKPYIVLHLIALAWQVPWPSDLDLYFNISRSSDFYTFYVDVPLSLGCIIRKVSAEDIAIRGNGTGLEYMCPTRHFVFIFFQPSFPTKHC